MDASVHRWRYAAGGSVVALFLWFAYVRGVRVPLLWAADLGFHELGHMLAIPLGETVHFLAGSSTQVLVPCALAGYFWWRLRDPMASGVMLGWAATSAQDASVYIADAPYQRLPLIGGHHDWAYLLGKWGALDSAHDISRMVWWLGLLAGLCGLVMCLWPLVDGLTRRRGGGPQIRRPGRLPVRPARRPADGANR